MHDIRMIRDNPAAFDAAMAGAGCRGVSAQVLALDEARRAAITGRRDRAGRADKAAKEVGRRQGPGRRGRIRAPARAGRREEGRDRRAERRGQGQGRRPDRPADGPAQPAADDVPDGADEDRQCRDQAAGARPRDFDFTPERAFRARGREAGLDFELAAKLSGARFVVLSGAVARVHRALAQFMLDTHVDENGLTEACTPVLVREEMMYGTGQLPKFGEDSYQTTNGWWLIPTAEVTLTNFVTGEMVEAATLPRRYVAHTLCFRSEAGIGGQGHRRHAAPAPVREGRDGLDHPPRRQRRRARRMTALRRGHPRTAWPALPHRRALHRRHGLWRAAHP